MKFRVLLTILVCLALAEADPRPSRGPSRAFVTTPPTKNTLTTSKDHTRKHIPRGGGRLNRSVTKTSPTSVSTWIQNLWSPDRLPWLVCTALSILYMLLFTKTAPESISSALVTESSHYVEGFCVQGMWDGTCTVAAGNSHQFAWGIDVLFTIVAMMLPATGWCRSPNSPAMMLLLSLIHI